MTWPAKPRRFSIIGLLVIVVLVVCPPLIFPAESTIPSSVDVYWQSTRAIVAPGVISVVILDEEIAHAQLGNDTIDFAGLKRGNTIALVYINGTPTSIVVHVIEHPTSVISPSLLRREAELAHGTVGSDYESSHSGGTSSFILADYFSWSQHVGDDQLDASSQFEENNQFGGHEFNLRSGNITYRTPHLAINVIDFSQTLTGELGEDRVNSFSAPPFVQLRGAGVTLELGRNEYSLFAGSTIPYYFLSLNATRDAAGFTFHRKETDRLSLFSSTSYVNVPLSLAKGFQRRSYFMQTAGVSYKLKRNWLVGADAGISNGGGLLRADTSYTSYRFSGYGTFSTASQLFPLNQLTSLLSGTSSAKGQVSYRTNSRLSPGFAFERTNISPGLIYRVPGSSMYLTPNLSYKLAARETLNFSYTKSRSSGGFTPATTSGNSYDVALSSQFGQHVSNNAQVTIGSVQDPLQINSQDRLSVRDSVSLPIKGQTLILGVEHDRVDPSLAAKLNQELTLLSPQLQAEFLANPAAFIESTNFPPEIKALLAATQPTGTTIFASTNLAIGRKLRLNPNVAVTRAANGSIDNSWTESVGYSLSYQFRPNLLFRSGLTNVLLYDSHQNTPVRTMLFSAGFQKSFSAVPGELPLLGHHERLIEGRVFRDSNVNGAYNVGEPGLAGVEVRLDDGRIAVTDAEGRYKFSPVSADEHRISVDLTQFRHPVRMTTRAEATADLIQQRIVVTNFGVLDFARLMGSVYNDLRFENHREPDSRGVQDVELLLDSGKEIRKIQTNSSGEFEIDDIAPGNYKLSVETSSLPPDYRLPADTFEIHVSPVSTVLQDIPVRALRSISGRVLLKTASNPKNGLADSTNAKQLRSKAGILATKSAGDVNQEFPLVPVGGVEIIAGPSTATTDDNGNFLLRNLPAGDLKVTIRPVRDVPDGINIPSGQVKLPPEPVQIQGASIVITNSELLPYLTREFPPLPGIKQETTVASGNTKQQTVNSLPKPEVAASVATLATAPPVKTEVMQSQASNPAVSKSAISTSPSTSKESHSAVELAKIPNVASAQATTASAAPAVKPNTSDSAQTQTALEATFTRAACQAFQSLGEAAQCFWQLKAMSTSSPQ
jgi:hypothetical protein